MKTNLSSNTALKLRLFSRPVGKRSWPLLRSIPRRGLFSNKPINIDIGASGSRLDGMLPVNNLGCHTSHVFGHLDRQGIKNPVACLRIRYLCLWHPLALGDFLFVRAPTSTPQWASAQHWWGKKESLLSSLSRLYTAVTRITVPQSISIPWSMRQLCA